MSLFLTNTQLLASQDINWWTGVVWIIVMFLSAVWTLILTAPIHCRGSTGEQVMQCYNSPNLFWRRNKFIYILNGWRDYSFKFPTINYSFNACFAAVTHVSPLCLSEKRCTTSLSMERQSFSSKTTLALANGSLPQRESKSSWQRIRSLAVYCPHLVLLPPVQETKTPNRSRSRARLGVKKTAVLLTRLHRTQQTFRPRRWACGHVYVCSWERVYDCMRGLILRCWV